jgi:hypothetical protein
VIIHYRIAPNNGQIPHRPLPHHLVTRPRAQQGTPQGRSPIDQSLAHVRLVFADQLHPLLVVLLVGERHPAADLHLARGLGQHHHLGRLRALAEVAQVALHIHQALLVGVVAEAVQRLLLGLQLGHPFLQLGEARGGHVIGVFTDAALHRLVGLGGGIVFVDEGTAHGDSPVL